jgi:hypothetical protein
MDVVKRALKQQLPAYLKARRKSSPTRRDAMRAARLTLRLPQALPLPDTFAGFAELKPQQWAQLAPLLATLLAIVFLTSALLPAKPKKAKPACVPALGPVRLMCACGARWRAARGCRLLERAASAQGSPAVALLRSRIAPPAQPLQHAHQAGLRQGARAAPPLRNCRLRLPTTVCRYVQRGRGHRRQRQEGLLPLLEEQDLPLLRRLARGGAFAPRSSHSCGSNTASLRSTTRPPATTWARSS